MMKNLPIFFSVVILVLVVTIGGSYVLPQLTPLWTNVKSFAAPQTMPTSEKSKVVSEVPANNIFMVRNDPVKGKYMTDFNGMTLYTFDKDTTGVSNCTGSCLVVWPLYTSGAVSDKVFPKNIGVINRPDGTKQFTWMNKPLYYYQKDKIPGDFVGDGIGGTWHLIKM